MRRWAFALLAGWIFSGPSGLQAAGKNALASLLVPAGARTAALGEAYAGIAQGAEALSSNPAGISQEKKREVAFHHVFFAEGLLLDQVSAVYPAGRNGAWGLEAGYLGASNFKRTVADASTADGYRELGGFSAYDLKAGAAWAQNLMEQLNVGAGARWLRQSLGDETADAFALDLGFLYRKAGWPWQAACVLQNLGARVKFKDEAFHLPRLLRAGFAYRAAPEVRPRWVPENSLVSVELMRVLNESENRVAAGVEVPLWKRSLTLRCGYRAFLKGQHLGSRRSLPNGFASGLGLGAGRFRLDYALGSLGDLGWTHRLGISFELDS